MNDGASPSEQIAALLRSHAWRHPDINEALNMLDAQAVLERRELRRPSSSEPRAPQDAPDVGSPWSDALNAKHARGESLTHDEQGELLEAYRTLLVAYHSTAALGEPCAPQDARLTEAPWQLTGPWRSGDPERGGFVYRFYAERHPQKLLLGENYETAVAIVRELAGGLGAPQDAPPTSAEFLAKYEGIGHWCPNGDVVRSYSAVVCSMCMGKDAVAIVQPRAVSAPDGKPE